MVIKSRNLQLSGFPDFAVYLIGGYHAHILLENSN